MTSERIRKATRGVDEQRNQDYTTNDPPQDKTRIDGTRGYPVCTGVQANTSGGASCRECMYHSPEQSWDDF